MWFKNCNKQNRIKMKKILAITSLMALSSIAVLAQDKKLKDVQEASLWAPAGVKADGKLTEWNDSFQALNKATKLYYTISNDEKNLYFVFKSTDMTTNNKVAAGGITIAVNTDGKKKAENAYSMTYPVVVRNFGRGQRPGGAGGGITVVNGGNNMRGMMGGSQAEMDSTMLAMRKQTLAQAKEIKVAGFKDIPDSLISLYNEHGVKAMANYDNEGNFLYEVAIPLKLIGLTTASTNEIAYNVRVNGLQIPGFNAADLSIGGGMGGMGGGFGGGGPDGGGAPRAGGAIRMNGGFAGGNGSAPRGRGIDFQEMMSPSDFWGKYTLAKK